MKLKFEIIVLGVACLTGIIILVKDLIKPNPKQVTFEKVDYWTDRIPVPTGWIVRYTVYYKPSVFFVPDPNHEWKLK